MKMTQKEKKEKIKVGFQGREKKINNKISKQMGIKLNNFFCALGSVEKKRREKEKSQIRKTVT